MNTTKTRRFSLYTVVSLIVNGFMLMAAGISYSHIVATSARLGVTSWQTYLVPAFVDGLAILGMIGRSEAMARQLADRGRTPEQIAAVKQFGFKLQLTAGLVSLAANFYAGETLGDQLFGLLVVGGFVITEKYSEKLRALGTTDEADAKPQITEADMQAYADTAVAAALAQAAIDTQAAIAAAATAARADVLAEVETERKRQARRDRAAAKRLAEIAPVSPATVAEIDSSLVAPVSAYEPAYL